MTEAHLLTIRNLTVRYGSQRRSVHAVNGLDLDVGPGEAVGIVGESGCGKSTVALALLGLLDARHTRVGGSILLGDRELVGLPNRAWQAIRGRRLAMIFQDPMTSLNPYLTIGRQVTEQLERHLGLDRQAARARAVELLGAVGIPNPASRLARYPHEFSGGMRQRVIIAMALSCSPDILIADEPTTALDVTIQAQILELVRDQIRQRNMGLILITHDLGIVAGACQRVAVMYAGMVVEMATVDELYSHPCHPYTRALLRAVPRLDTPGARLAPIGGQPPDLRALPAGCPFAPRCPHVEPACTEAVPPLRVDARGRLHRCRLELPAPSEVEA